MKTEGEPSSTSRFLRPLVLLGGAVLLAVVAGVAAWSLLRSERSTQETSAQAEEKSAKKAPAWELQDVDGEVIKSSDFEGKVVVLNFWATWCAPCRAEIPGFIALQEQYGEKGLVIVGVSLDQQGTGVVKEFMEEFGVNYPMVMGDETVISAFGGIRALPTTFFIDRSGDIVATHMGFVSVETFEEKIKPLL